MNPKRERFVLEYLVDLNGKQAAIRAGYSPASAEVTASQLLSDPKVKAAVDAEKARRAVSVQVRADDVLRELVRIATVDVSRAYDKDGNLLPLRKMPIELRRTIQSVESEQIFEGHGEDRTWTGYAKKIKFCDKLKSLELLGKHLKLYTDKVDVSGAVTINVVDPYAAAPAPTAPPLVSPPVDIEDDIEREAEEDIPDPEEDQ